MMPQDATVSFFMRRVPVSNSGRSVPEKQCYAYSCEKNTVNLAISCNPVIFMSSSSLDSKSCANLLMGYLS